ncbi:MarR family winged helix-turn-helix transcriptional regulator [Acuticoccus mangrovi]|uniref:MarR family transcriptional regulator n=1 Tax=Acuticoccus mangrovi TaxID=2796142 RepID=A0A934IMP0_9HYPH|nr:MarR family transcriptional regulator [Acuticoccus mangrovi]MBJ3775251.1 MarR family transcriptional regulator [Acuticoccus mangrovi]
MTATDAYVLDDQIGYLMRLASQRHTAIFAEHMDDLTPTQFAVLARLAEVGPSSQNQLGRLVAMDVATVKGVVDRLKAKDLIVFSADEKDGRRRVIALSEKGRARLPELHRMGASITEDTLSPLTARERDTLIRLMRKLT